MATLHDQLKNLVSDGLVIEKRHPSKPWAMYKYHRKVFYDNLWNESDALLESRGIVIADDGTIIQMPMQKVFNVGENDTVVPERAKPYRKVNGFMAAVTFIDGEMLVTTTGSFDSDFVKLATTYVEKLNWDLDAYTYGDSTWIFEICDPSDPHIVKEEYGCYLLTARHKLTASYLWQDTIERFAKTLGCFYANDNDNGDDTEGVVYYSDDGYPLCKTKTQYYLSKKALMRLGKNQISTMYNNREVFRTRLDEEFYDVFDYLVNTYTEEEYTALTEVDRRAILEEYFNKETEDV